MPRSYQILGSAHKASAPKQWKTKCRWRASPSNIYCWTTQHSPNDRTETRKNIHHLGHLNPNSKMEQTHEYESGCPMMWMWNHHGWACVTAGCLWILIYNCLIPKYILSHLYIFLPYFYTNYTNSHLFNWSWVLGLSFLRGCAHTESPERTPNTPHQKKRWSLRGSHQQSPTDTGGAIRNNLLSFTHRPTDPTQVTDQVTKRTCPHYSWLETFPHTGTFWDISP